MSRRDLTEGLNGRLAPQLKALNFARERARQQAIKAQDKLQGILSRTGASMTDFEEARASIQAHAQVVLNFHPDRLNRTGKSVAEALLRDGRYRNQFETGLSNGSLSAYSGGARDLWEEKLFGGAYQMKGVGAADRPKYGALDLMQHPDGAAPRFGSCYFVLRADVSRYCTFTYQDSYYEPEQIGTLDALDFVLMALLDEVEIKGSALGSFGLTVPELLSDFSHGLAGRQLNPSARSAGRALDAYIEAQVHRTIDLKFDIERLVADPAFRGTSTGQVLGEICSRYDIELDWHQGFKLPVNAVPDDFRGPSMPPLARRIASGDILDVAMIGVAAASLNRQPELWMDWGPYEETLQHLKQLWHVLVQYGFPANAESLKARSE